MYSQNASGSSYQSNNKSALSKVMPTCGRASTIAWNLNYQNGCLAKIMFTSYTSRQLVPRCLPFFTHQVAKPV